MARRELWNVGLNYEHPTGNGIGSYQNRHEIPNKIAQDMFITIGEIIKPFNLLFCPIDEASTITMAAICIARQFLRSSTLCRRQVRY